MDPQQTNIEVAGPADCDRVSVAMRNFYRRSHSLIDRIMAIRGASFSRARILTEIERAGSLRSIDLATEFGYAPRTVTEIIDGLERDGLVRREPDPLDRRAKRLTLTELGTAAAAKAEAARARFVQDVYGVLSTDECDEVVRIVAKLTERLKEFD